MSFATFLIQFILLQFQSLGYLIDIDAYVLEKTKNRVSSVFDSRICGKCLNWWINGRLTIEASVLETESWEHVQLPIAKYCGEN